MSIIDQLGDPLSAAHSLDMVDEWQDELMRTLINWSRINSGSRNLQGIKAMEAVIVEYVRPLGADIDFIDLDPTRQVRDNGEVVDAPNGRMIRITKRTGANRRLLMTGHTDTVFPLSSSFQDITWQSDGTLNGPGVADMKGGILVMVNALKAFEASTYAAQLDWQILLSPDEETGSLASGPHLADHAPTAHIGLTYEPALADGTLAGERKGSGNYTVVVKGRAAHAGREFFAGRNAVVHLASIISDLAALTNMRPGMTLNPAVITGGEAPNVVPDMALCRFNIRLQAPEDARPVELAIQDIIERHAAVDGFDVELHGQINRPPKAITDENAALMDLVRDCGGSLGINVDYVATGGCCEGNNLAAAGLPNVDTLGVRGGLIHSDREFMVPDSMTERVRLSALAMMAFADGRLDGSLAGLAA